MATPPSQASVKITKESPFKGGTRRWSNRYFLNHTTIADQTHFNTLADAIVAAEKLIFTNWTTIVAATGYNGGSDVPLWSRTYSQAGTSSATGNYAPLEVAALVRYTTTQRTTKNHPIYLFNYFHCILVNATSGQQDKLSASQKTLIETYANAWVTGFSDGTVTHKKAGPFGAVAQGSFVEEYVTHRDFPYTPSA
jgi:hypothetical protein